ncbi:hypothetical protein DFH09DRAFT_1347906 [Mycena vulgaris]|nr:hypothetical protein DFH09DRAFT_1347906 [Mycena vulgaris]
MNCTALDFDNLLIYLYKGPSAHPRTIQFLISVLQLATFFQLEDEVSYAIREFERKGKGFDPALQFQLARMFRVDDWIEPAFRSPMQLPDSSLELDHLGKIGEIGRYHLIQTKDEIRKARARLAFSAPALRNFTDCDTPGTLEESLNMPKSTTRGRNATPSGSGAKAGKRTRKTSSPPPARLTRRMHDPQCCPSDRSLRPRRSDTSTVPLSTLGAALHKDSKAVEYGGFVDELQRLLTIKYPGVFKIFPRVVCWTDAAQKGKYEQYYEESLRTNETTAQHWARNPIGEFDYSVALMYTWTISPVGKDIEEFGKVPWHFWALIRCRPRDGVHGKRIVIWDPNFGKVSEGLRERSLLGFRKSFVDVAKRGSGTAEIWVNHKVREENLEGRCVQLTLDWLQSLVEGGFDWADFKRVVTP